MDEKTLEIFAEAFIKELIDEAKVLCKGIFDEGKQFLGKSVKIYLDKQRDKYSSIKTLLRGNTPVFLYDVYFPINLTKESVENNRVRELILTDNISNVFGNKSYVTIIGDAGSGKSTLMKHLFLNAIVAKFSIPIMIELRYLNDSDGDIEKYIMEKIFDNRISQNQLILERFLSNGKFTFFLDGFDELNSTIKETVIKNLTNFIGVYNKNKFILTSRPYSNIENLPQFVNLEIKRLEDKEINGFIQFQLKKEKELAEKIIKSIRESNSDYIQSFLSNPLLLTLYILTFQSHAEIPDKKFIFYRRVINALFSEHDSKTKLGYVREKLSQLSQESFEEVLRAFSIVTHFEAQYVFNFDYINETLRKIKQKIKTITFDNNKFITDLKSAISLWVEDNGKYSFAHRSLQEYFAASFVKNLNAEENARAYETIRNRFGSSERRLSEYENFLSLCNEMDEVNFNKNYCIPVLKELRAFFDNSNRENLIRSTLNFFLIYIETEPNSGNYQIRVNPGVYRSIYFHLSHTQNLFNKISELSTKIPDIAFRHSNMIEFSEGYPIDEKVFEIFNNSDIYQIANKLLTSIENEIHRRESIIVQANKTDRELLDLLI